jgi:hypothetical protein
MMMLSVPFLYFFLPETKNVPLCVSPCFGGHRIFLTALHSEEMDRLFAPGLKAWNANKVVMADVRAARGANLFGQTASVDSEEKGADYAEHNEKASANGI